MKILHIASGDLWAGAEKQLFSLACALKQLPETEVEAIILNPGTLAQRLLAADIPTLILDEAEQGTFDLLRRIDAHLAQRQPDIVHTHRTKENILGGLAAFRRGIPSLRTQHGASEHAPNLKRRLLAGADQLVGRWMQRRVVAVSTPLAKQLEQRQGSRRVITIANGLEPGERPTSKLWDKPVWEVGIVGRLVPVKRVDRFLEIAALLARAHPGRFRFRIVGDGPLRQALEAQAAAIDAEIRFLGHVDGAEMAIAALDLLVLCSDHEGLPMVALEAMKAGTVIASHPIGALPELLDQGRCGLLVRDQSAAAFAEAICQLTQQPAAAAAMAATARERLERHYSAQAMARSYSDLYATLASR
jgi:glycosyltransferase involved in cell wall biosynthesis